MTGSYLRERLMRVFIWSAVLLLTLAYLLSGFMYRTPVYADEVTSRSIALSTSQEGVTATYTVSFTVPDTGTEDIGSFRVEFCNGDPLPGTTCTFTSGDNIPDLDSASLDSASFDDTGGTDECATISLAAVTAGDRHLDFTCNAVDDISASGDFTATVSGIVNPTNATESPGNPNNSFYARLYVYTTTTPTAIANPVTGYVHSGGVAMSTAEQLTITARVQEILEFCVGADSPNSAPLDCSGMTGNSVDLGVLDFASVNRSSTESTPTVGTVMVRTNASVGVVVDYFAEQDATGTNHQGALRVQGATCDATDPSTDETDQCINSIGWDGSVATQTVVTASDEAFGLCVLDVDLGGQDSGTATTNLTLDTEYDGLCDNSAGNGYAFDESGNPDTLATSVGSGGVVNDEMLEIDFAGTSDITTPSGLYTVLLTFIGTATF